MMSDRRAEHDHVKSRGEIAEIFRANQKLDYCRLLQRTSFRSEQGVVAWHYPQHSIFRTQHGTT